MGSLANTIIICVVLVVVIGGLILTCALGWTRILGCIIPDRLRKKTSPAQQSWSNGSQSVPTSDPEKSEFEGEPVTSPEATPVATPVGSPRNSRYDSVEEPVKHPKPATRHSTMSSKISTRYSTLSSRTEENPNRCSIKEVV